MGKAPSQSQQHLSAAITLTDEQRLNWLRLIRSDNVGPATFRDLINHFRSASAALEALPELISKGGVAGKIKIKSREYAEKEIAFAAKHNARFVGMGEPDYPKALRVVDYPPPLLCVKGSVNPMAKNGIAIVGSRNASVSGMRVAARFATELGKAGHSIVSGLARGIDASAHEHSLETGTIAVFAGGVDRIFPTENEQLAHDIIEKGGALVSEMPMGWQPRSTDFPRRNRLIAGISHATLVVEAAKRSGSLISARLANEAGRTVYAIPGSPLDPRSEGTNWLIKQGATLVTDPKDILNEQTQFEMPFDEPRFTEDETPNYGTYSKDAFSQLDSVRDNIISALGPSPVEVDDIIRFTGANISQVQLVLIELDLANRIERHGGNRVSLIAH